MAPYIYPCCLQYTPFVTSEDESHFVVRSTQPPASVNSPSNLWVSQLKGPSLILGQKSLVVLSLAFSWPSVAEAMDLFGLLCHIQSGNSTSTNRVVSFMLSIITHRVLSSTLMLPKETQPGRRPPVLRAPPLHHERPPNGRRRRAQGQHQVIAVARSAVLSNPRMQGQCGTSKPSNRIRTYKYEQIVQLQRLLNFKLSRGTNIS